GLPYGSHKVTASGGTAPYNYTITGLPDGLKAANDTVSGTPTKAGSFNVTVVASDAEGFTTTKTQTIVIAPQPQITVNVTGLPATGKIGLPYGSHKVTASGGTAPYNYTITGLPDGLKAANDTVSGTPTKAGSFTVSITAKDAEGFTATKTQTIVIAPQPIIKAQDHELSVMAGTTGTVNLLDGAIGDAITNATILSHGDEAAGTAWIQQDKGTQMLNFKAAPNYTGTSQISYILSNAYGSSKPAIVTINVIARPDPSKDPEVIGLLRAQMESAKRMTDTQIRNFHNRLESLHNEGDCRTNSIGVNLGIEGALLQPKIPSESVDKCSVLQQKLSMWSNGEISLGKSSGSDDSNDKQISHTGIGVSGGVDYRFSKFFIGGIGLGYGKDVADIGQNGTQSRASMLSLAFYGSYHPSNGIYLDGVLGYGWLNFTSDRFVTSTGQLANGDRKGQQLFGSASVAYEYRNESWLLSPYARVDIARTKLSSFSETGAGTYNLTYGAQTSDMLSTTLGLRGEYAIPMIWGTLKPRARFEYSHDFTGSSAARIGYTDIDGLLPYTVHTDAKTRDSIGIEVGFDAAMKGEWTLGVDYGSQIGNSGDYLQHRLRWRLSKQF
ncbi:autotransporter domain-containing protein, partial [Ochrobactrum sp. EDr1-4]|uniref:autotransporter domain-containing protein n=1 Tax=Ochrobactrum sp. EDr1-4 TaxID=3368622 RepID=UPI003BA1384C